MNVFHIVDTITSIHPGSCNGYTNLTDPWRNRAFERTDWPGYPKDDRLLHNKWWRFTGIGGDRASDNCQHFAGGFIYPRDMVVNYPVNESLTPTKGSAGASSSLCRWDVIPIEWVICPGGFHVFRPLAAGHFQTGYATYIDECLKTSDTCGPDSICTNLNGTYHCTCLPGFNNTNSAEKLGTTPSCEDIDECLEYPCGEGDCKNIPASFECDCHVGYQLGPAAAPPCEDIDECLNSTICGPRSNCTNVPGKHICQCEPGYKATDPSTAPDEDNTCEGI
ncbi:unnamed protein product [Arctogadus glacialis]